MKRLNKITLRLAATILVLTALLWCYASSLIGVNSTAKSSLKALKTELRDQGYRPNIFVISGRRYQLDNYLLTTFGNAAKNSTHKKGQAIDLLVLDVNGDGISNASDVDLVYNILNKSILSEKGGIGTYKTKSNFFAKQMVHLDCRSTKARWHK